MQPIIKELPCQIHKLTTSFYYIITLGQDVGREVRGWTVRRECQGVGMQGPGRNARSEGSGLDVRREGRVRDVGREWKGRDVRMKWRYQDVGREERTVCRMQEMDMENERENTVRRGMWCMGMGTTRLGG